MQFEHVHEGDEFGKTPSTGPLAAGWSRPEDEVDAFHVGDGPSPAAAMLPMPKAEPKNTGDHADPAGHQSARGAAVAGMSSVSL
ncbi:MULTISPECIES: hypothetical protein [Mesorhizobium]|uniref:hypothetical protein n=1 Tax=Mesorhizobium sp. TaxID=1871066 RepID=UPI0004946E5B|nr:MULTISPECIES: hypothetical protein [Mesorhizobium]RWM74874.1 MAG: hypothetical protein EOR82_06705 [Mesorhizobium sp.]TIO28206.1 MAG: hypothetical protein E5X83_02135 [Mesorhizobium sp.]TJV63084.1 MAG: hypothetical protein E5X82_04070 [Mesorhizobium sp.]